jgi:hypothetical protein
MPGQRVGSAPPGGDGAMPARVLGVPKFGWPPTLINFSAMVTVQRSGASLGTETKARRSFKSKKPTRHVQLTPYP